MLHTDPLFHFSILACTRLGMSRSISIRLKALRLLVKLNDRRANLMISLNLLVTRFLSVSSNAKASANYGVATP
jgi:hypothetical protein